MHEGGSALPPAGWYPDSFDQTRRRWWDGAAWTTHVAPLEAAAPAVAVLDRPAEISTAEYARRAAGYQPRDHEPDSYATEPVRLNRRSAQTLAGWLIALSPAWYGGLVALIGAIAISVSPGISNYVGLPVLGPFILGLVLLARVDGKQLQECGYAAPTSKFGWLPIVYLVVRVVSTGARSVGMLVAYVITQAVFLVIAALAVLVMLAPYLVVPSGATTP